MRFNDSKLKSVFLGCLMLKVFIKIMFFFLLVSCATSPSGRRQLMLLPAEQIDAMGVEAFEQLKREAVIEEAPGVNHYVTCVTEAVLKAFDTGGQQWEVVVFRDEDMNAFALPGAKVGVYTGLLAAADNQHRLATVIGHEIAHVLAQHGNERVSQEFAVQQGLELIQAVSQVESQMGQTVMGLLGVGAQVGILLPYSRVQEGEADKLGLELMARAGFDPRESVALWENMAQMSEEESLEFLSTHPSHTTRISDLNSMMSYAMQLYQQAQSEGRRPQCRL
jgi:predicted Zn-dependent protease